MVTMQLFIKNLGRFESKYIAGRIYKNIIKRVRMKKVTQKYDI